MRLRDICQWATLTCSEDHPWGPFFSFQDRVGDWEVFLQILITCPKDIKCWKFTALWPCQHSLYLRTGCLTHQLLLHWKVLFVSLRAVYFPIMDVHTPQVLSVDIILPKLMQSSGHTHWVWWARSYMPGMGLVKHTSKRWKISSEKLRIFLNDPMAVGNVILYFKWGVMVVITRKHWGDLRLKSQGFKGPQRDKKHYRRSLYAIHSAHF